MFEFLLVALGISFLAFIFGNKLGVFFGFVCVIGILIVLLIYGIVVGFGSIIGGLYALFTNISLGGGIIIGSIVVALILFILKKKNII